MFLMRLLHSSPQHCSPFASVNVPWSRQAELLVCSALQPCGLLNALCLTNSRHGPARAAPVYGTENSPTPPNLFRRSRRSRHRSTGVPPRKSRRRQAQQNVPLPSWFKDDDPEPEIPDPLEYCKNFKLRECLKTDFSLEVPLIHASRTDAGYLLWPTPLTPSKNTSTSALKL